MNEIWLCDVQFTIKHHKQKDLQYCNTEKLVLTIDENLNPIFKDWELQQKHNKTLTPTAKSYIVDLKVIKKVNYLGTPNTDFKTDKRYNYEYNRKYTGA